MIKLRSDVLRGPERFLIFWVTVDAHNSNSERDASQLRLAGRGGSPNARGD